MKTNWSIKYTDRQGERHTHLIEATTGREAQQILYKQLGVKRLVGVNIQPVQ
jgi:hypothetical protein